MSISIQRVVIAFAGLRVAYALGLLVAPGRVANAWIGSSAEDPGGAVALRGLGARDLVLSLGAAGAAWTGADARPWLAALATSDAVDLTSTLIAPGSALPEKAKPGTVAAAGGAGVIAASLAAVIHSRRSG